MRALMIASSARSRSSERGGNGLVDADHHGRLAGSREARQLERGDVHPAIGEQRSHRSHHAGTVVVTGDQDGARQLRVDLEAVEAHQVGTAVRGGARQAQ